MPASRGSLAAMPEGEQKETTARTPEPESADGGPIFSPYGIASTALALLSVAAVVLIAVIWSAHRSDVDQRVYQSRVLQAAADWTGVLINMNSTNVDASMQKLHDGTVGELNADFDGAIGPFRQVVQTLQARTTGQIEAVALESVHHDLDRAPGSAPANTQQPLPPGVATRTDTVLIVATSVSENVGGGPPKTVRWNLRLDVSDVDGALLVSRLVSLR